jgi:shikimate kinase
MKRIYLIGMPGSGKSTSGKRFAKSMGWGYADLDKLVMIRAQKPISALFEEDGEQKFRELEQFTLHETAESTRLVVGCGGGTAAWFNNIDWMLAHGMVIWLNIPEHELLKRLQRSKTARPLFPTREPNDLLQRMRTLYAARKPFFERASLTVSSEMELLALVPYLKALH